MALVGHWPFNGNLEDYSGNRRNSSSGWSFDDGGKIGKCIKKASGSSAMTLPITPREIGKIYTLCFWIYTDSTSTGSSVLFGEEVGENRSTFSLFQYPTRNDFHWSMNGNEGRCVGVLPDNKWTHITLVNNGESVTFYTNGNLSKTTSGATKYDIGIDIKLRGLTGTKLNDIRIYDEVLSLKEIKEVAKAKVLHYPMNSPEEECTKNLDDGSVISNGVNTSGTYRNASLVRLGPRHIKVSVSRLATDTSQGNWYPNFRFKQYPFTIGKTYAISCMARLIREKQMFAQLRHAVRVNDYGTEGIKAVGIDSYEWKRYTLVRTIDKSSYTQGSESAVAPSPLIEFYCFSNTPTEDAYLDFEVKDWQVEELDHATPYTSYIRNIGIGDASGFRNHGNTSLATCPKWDSSSIDGSGCFNFHKIGTEIIDNDFANITDEVTVSAWTYYVTREGSDKPVVTKTNSTEYADGFGLWDGYAYDFRWTVCNTTVRFDITNLYNTWHHIVGTYSSSTGILRAYVDGKKVGETKITAGTKITTNNAPLRIGRSSRGGASMSGKLSDIRVYATALSDTDIMALYNEKASIAKSGKMMVGELIEEVSQSNNVVTKDIKIKACGYPQGSTVTVNGTAYSGTRSWSILVIDKNLNYVSNNTYDVFGSAPKADEFIAKFKSIPNGYFVVIYTQDQPTQNNEKVLNYLKDYSPNIKTLDWGGRDAYFLVVRKGDYKIISERFAKRTNSETVGATTGEVTITLKKNKNSVTKKSQFITDEIDEVSATSSIIYNMPVKYQHRALWTRVYFNSKANLWTTAEVNSCNTSEKISYLGKLEEFRGSDGSFEFMLQYSYTSRYNRWKQTSNPMTNTSVSGYSAIHIDAPGSTEQAFVGLRKYDTEYTYLAGCKGSNWYYAIGPKQLWGNTIPCLYDDKAEIVGTDNKQELWARIDNVPKIFKMYKNGSSKSKEYIEC